MGRQIVNQQQCQMGVPWIKNKAGKDQVVLGQSPRIASEANTTKVKRETQVLPRASQAGEPTVEAHLPCPGEAGQYACSSERKARMGRDRKLRE